ncbi:MAG: TIGR03546 family protein [Planctomycetota bacterium]
MSDWLLRPLRGVLDALLGCDSTGQVAAGVAMGVVLGLLPKATLLAVLAGVLLCALRVNKAAGLTAAAVVAPLAPMLDGFTHKLGLKVLTLPSLQPGLAWFYDTPLGPWWGVHNTVVCGSLLLGLYLSYPVFLAARAAVERFRPALVRFARRYRLGRVLLGAEVGSRLGLGH